MTQNTKVEICSGSVQRALEAQKAGMWRVELCDDLSVGGITPSSRELQMARELLHIKLHAIIRPRGGDFIYSDLEFEMMKKDIRFCGEIACDGVVLGILLPDRNVDIKRTQELVALAQTYSMSVTFHRAIDESSDIYLALESIIQCGCSRILTSGGKPTAQEGAPIIRKMIEQSGERIIIMPGCGVTKENASQLINETGAQEIHGTFSSGFPF